MSRAQWGDHFEHRLELEHAEGCKGRPDYSGGLDQYEFCTDGCVSFNGGDFHLPVGKLAEFARTLYEAAGKPAPVILERPAKPNLDAIPGLRISPGHGGAHFERPGSAWLVAWDNLRQFAASLAALADEAESDPDPAEVKALAEEIRSDVSRIGGNPTEAFEIAARTALRWMREREATS